MAMSWSVVRSMRLYLPTTRLFVEYAPSDFPRRQIHACPTVGQKISHSVSVPTWATEAALYLHVKIAEPDVATLSLAHDYPRLVPRENKSYPSSVPSRSVDDDRMRRCLLLETEALIRRSYVTKINSIFFGGGTPSLAPASTIGTVIDLAKKLCSIDPDAEVTLEANPTSTEMSKLRSFREAGVNRISIGLQALNDLDLKTLGRQHSVQEALRCVTEAKMLFPGRTSVDVIFGRPGQTLHLWQKELDMVLDLCDDHVSLYQLTLERGTQLFKQVQQRELTLPCDDEMADMYECAVDTLEAAGFRRYEASNFARQGAESSHNQSYWRGGQYIGVGPGAHGRYMLRDAGGGGGGGPMMRGAFTQTLEPIPWMVEVERGGHATRRTINQRPTHILEEILMLGLRTTEGVPQQRWDEMGGTSTLLELFAADSNVQALIRKGLLRLDESGVVASRHGLNVIDSITTHLLYLLQDKTSDNESIGAEEGRVI